MTPDHAQDRMLRDLSELCVVAQDRDRSARTRARCRAELARRQRHDAHETHDGFGRRVLVPIGVLGLCVLYVVSLVRTALQLRGEF